LTTLTEGEDQSTGCPNDNSIIQLYVPTETKKGNQCKVQHQIEVLWEKYVFTRNSLDYLRCTHKRNAIRRLTHSLRVDCEAKIAKSVRSNSKHLKSNTKVKSSIPNGNEATTDFEKASVLNSYFGSVCVH